MNTQEDTKKAQANARARIAVELGRQGIDPSPANVDSIINAFVSATTLAAQAIAAGARAFVDTSREAARVQRELNTITRRVMP